MRVARIFVDGFLDLNQPVQIDAARAHYIIHVLRLKKDHPLVLFNGKGGEFTAHILKVDRDKVIIALDEFLNINRSSKLTIELGLAITKRDAMDMAIQKATELGATTIQPLVCDNTSVSIKGLAKKIQHWQQVALSACEQSGLNLPPTIKPAISFYDWHCSGLDLRLIANPLTTKTIAEIKTIPTSVAVAIGPEGGFTDDEMSRARQLNFTEISLGSRILRAETAAIALLTLSQSRWGDLQ